MTARLRTQAWLVAQSELPAQAGEAGEARCCLRVSRDGPKLAVPHALPPAPQASLPPRGTARQQHLERADSRCSWHQAREGCLQCRCTQPAGQAGPGARPASSAGFFLCCACCGRPSRQSSAARHVSENLPRHQHCSRWDPREHVRVAHFLLVLCCCKLLPTVLGRACLRCASPVLPARPRWLLPPCPPAAFHTRRREGGAVP